MKILVFISAGLGNALLMIPLLKKLRARGEVLVGVFTSPYHCEELFEHSGLFDEVHILRANQDWIKLGTANIKVFDEAYIDFFASTRKNILLANSMSRKTISNHIPRKLPVFLKHLVKYRPPVKGIHETTQNLKLLYRNYSDEDITEELIALPGERPSVKDMTQPAVMELAEILEQNYVIVQFSGANNQVQYKNWPLPHWGIFLKQSAERYPHIQWILVGDSNEVEEADNLMNKGIPNVHSLVGKTEVVDLVPLINEAILYVGVDSGLMHLAACLGKPTFTIWGASDFNLYGYGVLPGDKHAIVYNKDVDCRPCNSWISPNTSRVTSPTKCPDFKCIRNIAPQVVLSAFNEFVDQRSLFSQD